MKSPVLKRSMKSFGALLITLSAITPASSIFIIAPGVIQQAGTGAFLCFIAGAIVSLLTAYVYAELSSAFPLTGGEYTIVGRILGPFPGFIILGLNLVTLVLVVSVIALGIGNYISFLFPNVSTITAGLVTVIFTTLCAILNIRTNALITGAFLFLEMAALVVLAALGFLNIERPISEFIFNPVYLGASGSLEIATIGVIGIATSVAIFAYSGYGNAVYLGEETHDAPKRIAHIILWSLLISVIAEMVPITAVLMGTPDLAALFGSQNMFSDFVTWRGGEKLTTIVSLGIALAIINANIAFVVLVARLLFSTGRDRVWSQPINQALTRIHRRFHSPWVATLVCGVLASITCFVDLNLLLVITGTSIVVIYASMCIAVIAGRFNKTTHHGHYRMPFYPWPPILALGVLSYVAYANSMDEAIGRPSIFATLAMIIISAAYYLLVLRRKGTWILRGPERDE
ncbi:MAG: APC family permease [Alphaproteobacteria bacterium]